jgi:hypothetical protein
MITFREVDVSDAEKILKWRTSSEVSDFMSSEFSGDLKTQENWITRTYLNSDYYHWILNLDSEDAGLLSISKIDLQERSLSWGYYIGESRYLGLGALVPPFLYNHVIKHWKVEKIKAEVLEHNLKVIAMHVFHGYVPVPESDRMIEKDGECIKLQSYSLSSSDWLTNKTYQKFIADFPVAKWIASPFAT